MSLLLLLTSVTETFAGRGVVKPVRVAKSPVYERVGRAVVLAATVFTAAAQTATAQSAVATATAGDVVAGAPATPIVGRGVVKPVRVATVGVARQRIGKPLTFKALAPRTGPQTVTPASAFATATGVDALANNGQIAYTARGVIKPIRVRKVAVGQQRIGAPQVLAALALVPAQTATPPSALATATGTTPTLAGTTAITAASALATAVANAPTTGAIQTVQVATASAVANAPTRTAILTVTPSSAVASAVGNAPTLVIGGLTATGASAVATAVGVAPTWYAQNTLAMPTATATATAPNPTATNAWTPATAIAGAYGATPTTTAPSSLSNPIERQRWAPTDSVDAMNARLRRTVEVLDESVRVDVQNLTVTGTVGLTYPDTLLVVSTAGGAVTLTLPVASTVPGFRVTVLKQTGASALTVQGVTVSTNAAWISTGAVWRQVQ